MELLFAGKRRALGLGAFLVVAGLWTSRAAAQDKDLDPTYGSATLRAGFLPDPLTKKLTAGGPNLTALGGVRAFVAEAPDFKLHYKAGDMPLTIHVESEAETTLLINLPDGTWVASRHQKGGPGLKFAKPQSGRYDIWVGTVGKDNAPAALKITEREVALVKGGPADGKRDQVSPTEVVRQGFPAAQADAADLTKSETAWEIEWDIPTLYQKGNSRMLRIASAKFMWKDSNGQSRSLIVAQNILLAEAFTQYDDKATCFLDVAKVGTPMLPANKEFLGPACVGQGEILASKNPDYDNKVYKELHYDGLRWVNVYGGVRARKGEKLVLWSAIQAVNYVYLVEYNFTDDGRIVCRLGFTAHNLYDRAALPGPRPNGVFNRLMKIKEGDIHPHIGCWQLDFDLSDPQRNLGGPAENKILLVSRKFVGGKFQLSAVPFPGPEKKGEPVAEAFEGKAKWVAAEFTTLRAESVAVKNTRGQPIAYDLMSSRTGAAANLMPIQNAQGVNMDFINYDFWVTRTPAQFTHYYKAPEVAAGRLPLQGQRTTVWHSVGALHAPRDEDFGPGGVDAARGAALTEWVGFTLRPRNLFDGTPLFKN